MSGRGLARPPSRPPPANETQVASRSRPPVGLIVLIPRDAYDEGYVFEHGLIHPLANIIHTRKRSVGGLLFISKG